MRYPAFQNAADSPYPAENPGESGFPFAIVIGAALMIVGLGLVVGGVSIGDDSPLFPLGGIVFGSGVLRLTTALSKAARRRRAYRADPNDPRWHGGAGIKQLAGRSCAECGRKIVIGSDALSCGACEAAIHIDCEAPHRAALHGVQERVAETP